MRCSSCSIEVSKEMKYCMSANKCPACGKRIIESNSMACFVPVCELLTSELGKIDLAVEGSIESLAATIITKFDVLPAGSMPTVFKADKVAVESGIDPDDVEVRAAQIASGKKTLEQMREQAYNEAVGQQWGLEVTDEPELTPGPVAPVSMNGTDPGELYIDQKRAQSLAKMSAGLGSVKRSGG